MERWMLGGWWRERRDDNDDAAKDLWIHRTIAYANLLPVAITIFNISCSIVVYLNTWQIMSNTSSMSTSLEREHHSEEAGRTQNGATKCSGRYGNNTKRCQRWRLKYASIQLYDEHWSYFFWCSLVWIYWIWECSVSIMKPIMHDVQFDPAAASGSRHRSDSNTTMQ